MKLLLSAVALAIACSSFGLKTQDSSNTIKEGEQIANCEQVDLQTNLFRDYYNDLNETAKQNVSLQEFKDLYLSGNKDASELVADLNSQYSGQPKLTTPYRGINVDISLGAYGTDCYKEMSDADFMISNNHNGKTYADNELPLPTVYDEKDKNESTEYSTIREFDFGENGPKIPVYHDNNLYRCQMYLKCGDIVWDTVSEMIDDPNDLVTHMGLIVSTTKKGRAKYKGNKTFTFVETVEAYASGVRFGFLDDERILRYGTKVLRVSATDSERRQAVDFALKQLGKPYTLIPSISTYKKTIPDNSSGTWYCTQLVYSAYYCTSGIDLCANSRDADSDWYGKDGQYFFNVTGHMIYNGSRTSEVNMSDLFLHPLANFIRVKVADESWNKYRVTINNCTDVRRMIAYSDEMRNWGELTVKGVNCLMRYVTLDPHEEITVDVHKGVLKTSFQAYYIEKGMLYTTVAHGFYEYVNPARCLQFNFRRPLSRVDTLYPKIFLNSKNGSTWSIGVANISDEDATIEYNTKTCFEGDAMNWTDLKHISSISIAKGSMTTVTVTTNGLAECFTFSRVYNGNRYIGYAEHDRSFWDSSWYYLEFDQNVLGDNYVPDYSGGSTYQSFPLTTLEANTDLVYFFPNEFEVRSGYGQEWYELNAFIPEPKLKESDWSNVCALDVDVYSFIEPASACSFVNNEAGGFDVTILSRYPSFGAISVKYQYETKLKLDHLSFSGKYKKEYLLGEPFTYSGLVVEANYSCGVSQEVDDYQLFDDEVNTNVLGTYPVTVRYSECGITKEAQYEVIVRKPHLDSIEIVSEPNQTSFEVGDSFNYDGLKVRAMFEDGTWEDRTDFVVEFDQENMYQAGTYTVTVSLDANDSYASAEYEIVVTNSPLVSISLGGEYQDQFTVGDVFNYDNLVVQATFQNGYRKYVTDYEVDASEVDMNTPDVYDVYVSYTFDGVTKYNAYQVRVNAIATLSSITVTGDFERLYTVGDQLDLNGMIVTAHYYGAEDKIVSNYVIDASSVDMIHSGLYNVVISYTENGVTVTTSFLIHVAYRFIRPGDLVVIKDPIITIPDPGFGGSWHF